MTGTNGNNNSVKQYRDKKLKWRWQVKAGNGEIIGASTQGYTRKVDCSTNMHRVAIALTPPIKWAND